MISERKISNALISVYHKTGLDPILHLLHKSGIGIYATGGTFDYIVKLGIPVTAVEDVTRYPEIFGGRVKTLHPAIFGGILNRRDNETDIAEVKEHHIPNIDLVIVDLYPFEATVASNASEADIIEKIDIGGISLIRAAAKNFKDVVIIPSLNQYEVLQEILSGQSAVSTIEQRKKLAAEAFAVSSHYDSQIFLWLNKDVKLPYLRLSVNDSYPLRYGENPHQEASFFGDLNECFEQLNGKEISYNNLLDIDSSLSLLNEFESLTVVIIKHNNACGLATRSDLLSAWKDALAGDPVSAFGGVIATNVKIDEATATEMNKLFFEILIAPDFSKEALDILQSKKNRILLKLKSIKQNKLQYRSSLNGILAQEYDNSTEGLERMKTVTRISPDLNHLNDLVFANKIVKHTKSNTIVLAKNNQLIGSGTGQTSRVDALLQAIEKAKKFGFDTEGSVMASDAFFPFPDCVEIADKAGVKAVVQPGGSVKDQESIDYCDQHGLAMVMTGIRHFRH